VAASAIIPLINLGMLKHQLGARPTQFQKELGFGEELVKILGQQKDES
jgi:hypothetical protein